MIFKDWTYRQKNKGLLVFAIVLLVLSWYLAFGKTFALIGDYNRLRAGVANGQTRALAKVQLREKLARQDSLLQRYAADSTLWVGSLLSQVGGLLSTQPVGVSYENKAVGTNSLTAERDLVLNGSFAQLQKALRILEKDYFVKSIRAYVEKEQLKYSIRLVSLKTEV
ncbi:hypothetical protein [Sphingobacterium sp. LRF_L2]|uniref:hypothetical protein n=1 Tax=Sphingobacterium sp. LRF_L2 TaxID=3369421 RepID=UPI003F5E066D